MMPSTCSTYCLFVDLMKLQRQCKEAIKFQVHLTYDSDTKKSEDKKNYNTTDQVTSRVHNPSCNITSIYAHKKLQDNVLSYFSLQERIMEFRNWTFDPQLSLINGIILSV